MGEIPTILANHVANDDFVKITLSKPRHPDVPYKNVYIRPIKLKDVRTYQVIQRTKTQDFTHNLSPEEMSVYVIDRLESTFYNANIITTLTEYHILQSKKGQCTIKKKNVVRQRDQEHHDRPKNNTIPSDTAYLQDLGLTSNGTVLKAGKKKYRQINKYVEILSALLGDDKPSMCYDMGSGKGYLTFSLYDILSRKDADVQMYGVEYRTDLVEKCNRIAKNHSMAGLHFVQGSIDSYEMDNADMVIALHACDIATDMAIAQGIKSQSRFIVVSPCCHKQVRKAMSKDNHSSLSPLLHHGILLERQAELITDGIRALLLESRGYETRVFEFIDSEHTSKNLMITAKYSGKINTKALQQIERIKEDYGIEYHYLENLLS